jgi:DNA helicase MCM8
VELRDNLPSKFISGDFILVNGTLKTEAEGKAFSGLYVKYILCSSIFELESSQEEQQDQTFTQEEMSRVNKLASGAQLFLALINSFCPTIYGNEIVKAGVLLTLVGGSRTALRSNCHCLLMGDPG